MFGLNFIVKKYFNNYEFFQSNKNLLLYKLKHPILYIFIKIFLLLTFITSCDNPVLVDLPPQQIVCKDTTYSPLLRNWLISLIEGNYWEYKLESHFDEDSVPLFTSHTTQRILGSFNAFTECNVYKTVIYDRGFETENMWVYWQDSTGFYSLGGFSENDSLITKNLLSKYPVKVGDQWESQKIIFSSQNFSLGTIHTYTCFSNNTNFTTPAGTFNCYVYYYREKIADDIYGFYDIYNYIVPKLGQVGQVFITGKEPSDSIRYIYNRATLINYHLQ